jgi:hypothetical protein
MKNFKQPTFLVFTILFCMFFSSCETDLYKQRELHGTAVNINGYEISVVVFDSCEYLISGYGYSQMMTHKGNCKYCTKRSSKQ